MALHIIGDSHAAACFGGFEGANIHAINSRTMHGVYNQNLKPDSHGVKAGDTVVWIFGEIDIRAHALRIADETKRPVKAVICEVIDNFMEHVLRQQKRVEFTSIVSCIVPPSDLKENVDYPFYGTLAQRVEAARFFNSQVFITCLKNQIPFLDWSHHFELPDGSLDHTYSDQHVHIAGHCNQPCHEALTLALTAMS